MAIMKVSARGFTDWKQTLRDAQEKAPEETRKVVEKGAHNIKEDWRKGWTGFRHAPSLPFAVTYDVSPAADIVKAEIGPDKAKRQGALGNLLEFGSINNRPHPDGALALEVEAPRFADAIESLGVTLLTRNR